LTTSFEGRKISAIIACCDDERAIPIIADRLEQRFLKVQVGYEILDRLV